MSRMLIGIAAVTSGLALLISMSANAASVQAPREMEYDSRSGDKRMPLLKPNREIMESETATGGRFPLMLPQPTKVDGRNTYDLS